MNKLQDLTSQVEYIRGLIDEYKRSTPDEFIPLYYVTDDELTNILSNYSSTEAVDDQFGNYYTKIQIDAILSTKIDFDKYVQSMSFDSQSKVLSLTRSDNQILQTVIDINTPPPVDYALAGDLTNEIDSFPVNSQNETVKAWQFSTVAHVFYGSDRQIITACTAVSSDNNVTTTVLGIGTAETTIQVNVPTGTQFTSSVNISISVTCSYGTRVMTFTLVPIVAGEDGAASVRYYLQPSLSQIKKTGEDTYADYSIECYKMVQIGNSAPQQTSSLTLRMAIDGGSEQNYSQIILAQVRPNTKIQYSLYDSNNILYDRETIVVVKDGAKGDTGQRGPKGEDGESESLSYGISFNQTAVGEGATNVGITVWKIDNDGYHELNASNCSVSGLYDATNCVYVDLNDKFYFEYLNGVAVDENYTVALYVDGNIVARSTLTVVKGRSTQVSIKKWSSVAIGDWCYSENAVSGKIALADVVIDDVLGTNGKYLCVSTYQKVADSDLSDTTLWIPFDQYENVSTDLLLADKAYIKNLLLNYTEAIDQNGDTTVSIDGETGKLTVINGQFMGSVAIPYTVITEDNFDDYVKLMPGSSDQYYIDFSNAHCNIQINYWRNFSTLPTYHIVLPSESLDSNYGKEIRIINYIPEKVTLKVKNPNWIDENDDLHRNAFYTGYTIEYGYEAVFKLVELSTYVKQRGSTLGYQFKSFADNDGNPTDNCWRLTDKNSQISTEDSNYNTPIVYLTDQHLLSAANKAWNYGGAIIYKHYDSLGTTVTLYPLYKRYVPQAGNDYAEFYFFNDIDSNGWELSSSGWSTVSKANM